MGGGGMGRGFAVPLYAPAQAEQQAIETDTVVASPMGLEPYQIKELIEWLEGILVNEHVKKEFGEEKWEDFAEGAKRILESLKKALED